MKVIEETQHLKVRTSLKGQNFPTVSPNPLGKEALIFNFNVIKPKATFGDEEFNPNIHNVVEIQPLTHFLHLVPNPLTVNILSRKSQSTMLKAFLMTSLVITPSFVHD